MLIPSGEIARPLGLDGKSNQLPPPEDDDGMERSSARTPDAHLKELMIFALVYNMVRGGDGAGRRASRNRRRQPRQLHRCAAGGCAQCLVLIPKGDAGACGKSKRTGRWSPRVLKRRPKGITTG